MDWKELGPWGDRIDFLRENWDALSAQVERAYETTEVYPPREKLFAALNTTPPERVRVVILGQDPYHEPGQAHGLSFSVEPGVAIPKSLGNIYKEMESDLGLPIPKTGCLLPWAKNGVLLLNAVLTVEALKAGSHRKFHWERFTDQVIQHLNAREKPMVFILWGGFAKAKEALITGKQHCIIKSVHPSPLSAHRGYFGGKYFSRTNAFLQSTGQEPIDWSIPE